MGKIFVNGGHKLDGEITISGMKNSALPIIFACLLVKDECIIENIPRVSDIENALSILRDMGAEANFVEPHTIKINTKRAHNKLNFELISKMRASSYLMSTCLSRYGKVHMPYPGGCNFGSRPIEQHIKGFKALGAVSNDDCDELVDLKYLKKPKSGKIILDKISVGATINMIMASVLIEGKTIIQNVAREPHVLDLIRFLNNCGANITLFSDKIEVFGVKKLNGIRYRIYSDMIEALTFISSVGVAKGRIILKNFEFEQIECLVPLFKKMGIDIFCTNRLLSVRCLKTPKGADVITTPYPGFPTDLHPQFSSLLCFCKGGGSIVESIFPGRFAYVTELKKMGAKIEKLGNKVIISKSKLIGASTDATDLRAGAALVVAALGAEGTSVINNVNYIVRGYESFVEKLYSIGSEIKYIKGE